jgi:hypothetical protein
VFSTDRCGKVGPETRNVVSSVWLSLSFGGQHYDEILISLGGLRFGENFEVNFGGGVLHEKHAVQRGVCVQ